MSARIKLLLSVMLGVIFLGFFAGKAWAEIKINEFSSDTTSDWVEIYNTSDQEVNLSNYSLIDGSSSGNTKTFSCILKPKGFLVMGWGKNLNNAGDIIKFKNGDTVIDCVTYGNWPKESLCEGQTEVDLNAPGDGEFATRSEDGIGSWIITTTSTKDGPNDGSQKDPNATCVTPSPSPSPSPTPEPDPTPSPESESEPTPSPVVSPSPKTTTTVTGGTTGGGLSNSHDSEEMLLSTEGGEILGMTEPETSEATESKKEKNPFVISVILVVLGLGLVGGTGVVFYKQRGYNETHEESGET